MHPSHPGFRSDHSCETAFAKLIDIWSTNMEIDQLKSVIFVDLRKAFEVVHTNILLPKLALYHCDESSIFWFTSYLQGRTHCFQFKSATSPTIPFTHGVLKGSILGPLLFITFMNDLPLNITSNTDMYADDSSVHTNAKTVVKLNEKLNQDMVNTKRWCMDNNMAVNQDKSQVILITTYQKATTYEIKELNVTYDGNTLQNVEV